MSRWDAKKNIEFINAYKVQKCLWDPNHALYKNRDAREAAYNEIKEKMDMTSVKEVIGRIRLLRNTLNNELLKAKKHHGTPHKTRIPWLPYLEFVKNIDNGENTDEVASNSRLCFVESVESTATASTEDREERPPQLISRQQERSQLVRAVKALETVVSQRSYTDEFELFGQTVAQQLRQLPLGAALETEEMVLAVIRQQRVKIASQLSLTDARQDEVPIVKVEEPWWQESSEPKVGPNPAGSSKNFFE